MKLSSLPDAYLKWSGGKGLYDGRNIDGPEIARAYLNMPHTPHNPIVREAYAAFKRDLSDQYDFLQANGFKLEPWTKPGQPYDTTCELVRDVYTYHRVYFFKGGDLLANHPLSSPATSKDYTYNEIFRGVHDIFGHAVEGNPFETFEGEIAAYRAHSQMFSRPAWPALFTETVGQLCAYWFGGGQFPEQKAGVIRL